MDEAADQLPTDAEGKETPEANASSTALLLAEMAQLDGVEFLLATGEEKNKNCAYWGVDNPGPMAEWTRDTLRCFRSLGDVLQVGQLQQLVGTGSQRKVSLATAGKSDLCVGFAPELPTEQLHETMNEILVKWAS